MPPASGPAAGSFEVGQASDDAATDWLFVNETHTVVRTGVYGVPSAETTNRFALSGIAVGK